MRRVLLAVLLLLALAAPGAQAALTKPLPFHASYGYLSGLDASDGLTLASGALDATNPRVAAAMGILNTSGFTMSGLTRACWDQNPPCRDGQLSLSVSPGGSVGLCFPAPVQVRVTADHAIALFADLRLDKSLNDLPVDRSLVAPAVNGQLTIAGLSPIPASGLSGSSVVQEPCSTSAGSASGGLAALTPQTSITVRDAGNVVTVLSGQNAVFLFAGDPALPAIASDFLVVPFDNGSAELRPASASAARVGLDLGRVTGLLDQLQQSSGNQSVGSGLKNAPSALRTLLNGALLRVPTSAGNGSKVQVQDITFVRFTAMTVTGDGGALDWSGTGLLALDGGHVAHTGSLVKVWVYGFPWWSFLLWAAAIVAWVVAVALKAPKKNEQWDRLRWIGWVAGPLAFLFVMWLIDLEVLRIAGSSFLHGTSGSAQWIFLAIDFAFAGTLSLMVQIPLRILLRAGFRLLRQGTLMGLAGPTGTLLGFFIGFSYFRAYLDLILTQVVHKLG